MVQELDLPLQIRMCPIIREPDGLALSSRNRYLTPTERRQALAISAALVVGRTRIEQGERRGERVREAMRRHLSDASITRVEYVAVADPESLSEVETVPPRAVLLIAAFVGETRLIDNCLVG
jgi:pantoate--beta-alanine ligase